MDQIPAPGPPRTFHLRLVSILSILFLLDVGLVFYSVESITYTGVTSMVLFASEFMILLASISGSVGRYTIGVIDLRRARGREDAPSWEEKSMYIFYVDLAVGELSVANSRVKLTTRLRKASNLPHLLHCHLAQLWPASPYSSRRLHDFPLVLVTMLGSRPLPTRDSRYGCAVPQRHCAGDGDTRRSNLYHLSRRDDSPRRRCGSRWPK